MSIRDDHIVSLAFDQATDAMIITDAAETVVRVNRQFVHLTGYEPEEIVGRTPALLHSGKNEPQLFDKVWAAVNATGHWRGEIWDRKKSGRLFIADLTITAVTNHHHKVTHYLGVYRDITAAKEEQLKRQQQENREGQTFLLNRPAFFQQLKELCEAPRRPQDRAALLLINLDRFHQINEQYGLAAGDDILYEAAGRLRKSLRDIDIIGRLDGDEFGVILTGLASQADIEAVTGKLLDRLMIPYPEGAKVAITVPCSIGLAPLPEQGTGVEALLHAAGHALRRAKSQGGGRWIGAE
jgi:diguanylate cyclase (GGDEF)-like protein/PAS domain S-box-containing protein